MTADPSRVLALFRRQMAVLRVLRVGGLVLLLVVLLAVPVLRPPWAPGVLGAGLAVAAILCLLAVHSVRLAREVQAGGVLIGIGKLDDAEIWLRRGMTQFSLSWRAKVTAAQLMAVLLLKRGAYDDVIALCTALLGQRVGRLRHVWIDARLMLADCLLRKDRLAEADEALAPVRAEPLPLEARMSLLTIQLRYDLAAGRTGGSISDLRDKVRLAELMDGAAAALAHALLAEACRRENLPAQQAFLAERARLYHDLEPLAEQWPVIAPIAAGARIR